MFTMIIGFSVRNFENSVLLTGNTNMLSAFCYAMNRFIILEINPCRIEGQDKQR
jgi:hypothetical protein